MDTNDNGKTIIRSESRSQKPKSGITRRDLMSKSASVAGTFALTSAIGIAPKFIRPARAGAYAPGMTGGPTGFAGAERFQYNETMSEGRAIEGIKKLQAAGKAPKKLSMLLTDGAIGQITKPFPVGKIGGLDAFPDGAPSVKDVWERETGIEIEIIGAPAEDIFKKVMQDVTTGSGTFDIFTGPWNSTGDLADANGIVNCDEYVAKYMPDWGDPERGTPTPEMEKLLYTYAGSYYAFSLDGDFQTWFYNRDLYENPDVRALFEDKYDKQLGTPATWEDVDNISEFFTGRDFGAGTMYGNGNLMSPFWGLATFYARFASMAFPNNYFFDEEGRPALDSDLGIRCAEEHVRSFQWCPPDALTFTWAEAYNTMWNLQIPHTAIYTNLVKFGDGYNPDGTPKSKATGKLSAHLPVGRDFDGKFNRRSVLYYHITGWISAKSQYPEAAYLFMQWLSSTRTYTWMCGNPGGYFDPMQQANFKEPLCEATYHDYSMEFIPKTIARSVPSINFAGQTAFDNALDEELQAAITGQKTAAEAMRAASKKWQRIIRKRQRKGILDAIAASRQTWPSIVDDS
ncbi:extracellular solute-binding protein [Hoeflea sp. TYP-13]|uniref:extracellular solute-binding protein n=1 Tax=Hoeflea sp. TYP-13 TaxID=3230023 RepID=UPI0034C66040